jgi:hypothetical protein
MKPYNQGTAEQLAKKFSGRGTKGQGTTRVLPKKRPYIQAVPDAEPADRCTLQPI